MVCQVLPPSVDCSAIWRTLPGDISYQVHRACAPSTTWTETWQPGTTADNLKLILRAREQQGGQTDWLQTIIDGLVAAADGPPPDR